MLLSLLQEGGVGLNQGSQAQVGFALAPLSVQGRQIALLQEQRNRRHNIAEWEAGDVADGHVLAHVHVIVLAPSGD